MPPGCLQGGSLSENWVPTVFNIAVFGPVPKKEHKVIDAAYEMIYEDRVNNFNDIQRPFEVVQRASSTEFALQSTYPRNALCLVVVS